MVLCKSLFSFDGVRFDKSIISALEVYSLPHCLKSNTKVVILGIRRLTDGRACMLAHYVGCEPGAFGHIL
jgi:hypothetical protein